MATDRASRLRGSSSGPHPRIRAAEACCVPSYDPEIWLPVSGCRFGEFGRPIRTSSNAVLPDIRRRLASRTPVAARLPVAGCRLPTRLPVAAGCRP